MNLEEYLVEENMSVNDILKLMEKYKEKIFFIVENKKLLAAVSDGDIRRFLIRGGDISTGISKIANYNPKYIYENQIKDVRRIMMQKGVGSMPVLNFNNEVVSVIVGREKIDTVNEKFDVPVVIMAGGLGTRLYPYTRVLPKPLIPIKDIPIIEHIMNRFYSFGSENFYLIVNHKKNMIKAYLDCIDKEYKINYVDEGVPLGTGGGLSLLKGKINKDFFFSNCDIIIDSNYADMYKFHKKNKNFITIIASKKRTVIPYGVIMTNNDCSYDGMNEKPEYNFLINTGLYIVNSIVINELENDNKIDFPDIIENYRQRGYKIGVYIIEEKAFLDMGQLKELEEMKKKLEV